MHNQKNLFLSQSYIDAYVDYKKSLTKSDFVNWDCVIITASNENQANSYMLEVNKRLENGQLPSKTHFAVIPDPDGKRVGSGGATLNVLKYLYDKFASFKQRVLIIHSGGDSKRVPQYSACGKLFSPVPRLLPGGRCSTLFDEIMISMSGVPARMKNGIIVMSGDVLLLFNSLQLDFQFGNAAAISMKQSAETGKNHGVFLSDGKGNVQRFLHKQSVESLNAFGAVNEAGKVDIDTGAVFLDYNIVEALFSLMCENGSFSLKKYNAFVNEKARLSFYGDFLYPLSLSASLEDYYKEAPEGEFCDELNECRTAVWGVLNEYNMKLLNLSPAQFIHFGTSKELLALMTTEIDNYRFLSWHKKTGGRDSGDFSNYNSYVAPCVEADSSSYFENSDIGGSSKIGRGCIVSGLTAMNISVPDNTVFHALHLVGGDVAVRVYGVGDNPKCTLENNGAFLNTKLRELAAAVGGSSLWDTDDKSLWLARLYPVCRSESDASLWAMRLCDIAKGDKTYLDEYIKCPRTSLFESFNQCDAEYTLKRSESLAAEIRREAFLSSVENNDGLEKTVSCFDNAGPDDQTLEAIEKAASSMGFKEKIRSHIYLSTYFSSKGDFSLAEKYESMCFSTLKNDLLSNLLETDLYKPNCKIQNNCVDVKLPVRVNFGGGWTDTPPYCNENGGCVLNAAINLNGDKPVRVRVKRLDEKKVVFESEDAGSYGEITSLSELQNCSNPFDPFALHKAALIAGGIISKSGKESLEATFERLGGGIYLSTQVDGIPRGSGLGTSSILSGACIKALNSFTGETGDDNDLYSRVMCMEQLMSTGGGWQDQVGGLTNGIKLVSTEAGIKQDIQTQMLELSDETKAELQQRFALIYTGQRRLARNLLREVVGKYIKGDKAALTALKAMGKLAVDMKNSLEAGDIDAFASQLNEHWEFSKMLDSGCTNTCIDQIFLSCEDLIDGKFISGAGGGGFLQVILKKSVTHNDLDQRLKNVFEDSGVGVWKSEFVY